MILSPSFLWITWVALVCIKDVAVVNGDEESVVSLPHPFYYAGTNPFKITSESTGEDGGYQTNEEYIDLVEGRAAYVITNKDGYKITYVDAVAHQAYIYKPYTCERVQPDKIPKNSWSTEVELSIGDGPTANSVGMKLHGIIAYWMYVIRAKKTYSKSDIVYSASKDIFRASHKWTAKDEDNKISISMSFMEMSAPNAEIPSLELEMIQVESLETKKVLRTFNILAFERSIDQESIDNYLQVPIGYGCLHNFKDSGSIHGQFTPKFSMEFLKGSYKFELEVTSTKFTDSNDANSRASDTMGVVWAQTIYDTHLVHIRNHNEDTKTVISGFYGVSYNIDLRRGQCQIKHIDSSKGKENEIAKLKFANNITINLSQEFLQTIFIDLKQFDMVRKGSAKGKAYQSIFFERSGAGIFGPDDERVSRIIRKYSIDSSENPLLVLESVTIWVLSTDSTKIIETYHFNVIAAETMLSTYPQRVRVFDISEECYINNDEMKNGRDYAWIEFTYPVTSQQNAILAANSDELKQEIHRSLTRDTRINPLSAPKVEIIFEDDSFVARLLVLDRPPLETVYDFYEGKLSMANTEDQIIHDGIAPDLKHCAEFCRLQQCAQMSFCEGSHRCLMLDHRNGSMIPNKDCNTYRLPQSTFMQQFQDWSLHNIISPYQHQDFTPIALPKMPEEVALPPSETGIDLETYENAKEDYRAEVMKALQDGPYMSLILTINGHMVVLVNSKFEVEEDPLNQFNLIDSDSELMGADELPAFHKGLLISRFNMASFHESAKDAHKDQPDANMFNGISYDQCALACMDSKCGSFSYCDNRRECIISNINSTGLATAQGKIISDPDCFVAQRDFLRNFHKYQNVFRPQVYKKMMPATDASECALNCVSEKEFKCLAFDFCSFSVPGQDQRSTTNCFYHTDRYRSEPTTSTSNKNAPLSLPSETGCDHYSRSSLADFLRIEYREIEPNILSKAKTSFFEGKSIFQCAELCANELVDCSAFQFCLDDTDNSKPMQSCTMVEEKLKGDPEELKAVVDESNGSVVKTGKYLVPSRKCHLFSIRKDSSEAHLRDLALSGTTLEESREAAKRAQSQGGLTIGGGILLYICVASVSAAIGCAFWIAKDRNDFLRQKVDRVRVLLRL